MSATTLPRPPCRHCSLHVTPSRHWIYDSTPAALLQQQPLTRLISDNEHLSWTCHRWLQGRRWGLHVVEAPWAWLLAAIYIAATVISRHPPFIAIGKVSSVHTLPALFKYTLLYRHVMSQTLHVTWQSIADILKDSLLVSNIGRQRQHY